MTQIVGGEGKLGLKGVRHQVGGGQTGTHIRQGHQKLRMTGDAKRDKNGSQFMAHASFFRSSGKAAPRTGYLSGEDLNQRRKKTDASEQSRGKPLHTQALTIE